MTTNSFTYDIFISYSHKDSQWVKNWLLPRLEDAGLDVIIDFRDFEIGVPSIVNMENAVQESRHVLLVVTPNWVNSEWTDFEALLIQTTDPAGVRRRTLPLMLRDADLPTRLAMLTYADFTDSSTWETELQRVLTSVTKAEETPRKTPRPQATPSLSSDPFVRYEHGLQELEKHIGQHEDLLVYEQQLRENMADARRFGDTADKRSERARIVSQLNRFALDTLGVSFNELCGN